MAGQRQRFNTLFMFHAGGRQHLQRLTGHCVFLQRMPMRQRLAAGLKGFVVLAQTEMAMHLLRLQLRLGVRCCRQRRMGTPAGTARLTAFQRKGADAVAGLWVTQAVQIAREELRTQGWWYCVKM